VSSLRVLFPPSLGKAKASARAEVLEPLLSAAWGAPVEVSLARDYADLEARAVRKEADVIWAPSGVCALLEGRARAIFKVVRGGSSTYRAALVTRKSHPLTLDDLKGKSAAWVDPLSVGGYLLLVGFLRARGLEPDRTFSSQRFSGSHPGVLQAILHGEADVGAVTVPKTDEASLREVLQTYAGGNAERISVIAVTDEAPTDALVLTDRLSTKEAVRLSSLLAPPGLGKGCTPLLSVLEADALVPARDGEYGSVLRLIRAHRPFLMSGFRMAGGI
jgi:phosphonate transport system substrate-binding protein